MSTNPGNKSVPYISDNGNPLRAFQILFEMSGGVLPVLERRHEELGDFFYMEMGGGRFYIIIRPEHVRELLISQSRHLIKDEDYTDSKRGLARFLGTGLLTSEGEFWKRQRKMVAPAFHARRVDDYAATMARYSAERVESWQDGRVYDIAHEMTELTLRIISYTMLKQTNIGDMARIAESMVLIQNQSSGVNAFLPEWVPTPGRIRSQQAVEDLDDVIYRLIAERRAEGDVDHGDLLSMLLLTEDEAGERMTDKQVRDELATLFLAGHETTANAMNWTWLLLSQNPDAEARLHAELDTVLGGRLPTLADLRNLPYVEKVVKESMRLFPPAPTFSRMATADLDVDGYTIPKGSIVAFVPYLTHRHGEFWDDPLAFRPERFDDDAEGGRDKWAYYPFGGGARVCIGQSFAMLEAQIILASIASLYQLRVEPGFEVEPYAAITLYPKNGLRMIAQRRQPTIQGESADSVTAGA